MLKKLIPIFLCLTLALGVGCSKQPETLSVDKGDEPTASQPAEKEKEKVLNPLTGIKEEDLTAEKAGNRPVAIMVNNMNIAQPVQTGLTKADVIYETEVEGGITRLMAVYQDISSVEKIGAVRSCRYAYIDLALGHNAIYVHHGADPKFATPHLADTDHLNVGENNGAARISNGLAKEHTLYAYGDKVWETLITSNRTIKNKNNATWLNFASETSPVTLDNTATSVSVPFSNSYKTTFKYDEASGRYVRYFNGTERKDYVTNETITVKNVFVLTTTIGYYTNIDKHRNISLESGSGYYFVNGTYTPITWSKGAANNSFVFKTADGGELTVNPGNSWVCIADKNTSKPVIE